ncbi:MAG: PIN domain-containing protein [Streptosporangiaceae bacterium]
MLVVLDTTAILSDPMCAGVAWRILANARSVWGVQVYVPEVVVIEAVAGYQRRLGEATVSWGRWEQKHGRPLGLTEVVEAVDVALKEAASSYPVRLRASLDELDATVIAAPDVDHSVVVQRAASRRRPCDDNGNGYRDTLNWLTVLSLASQFSDDQIVWVSNNSRDFGQEDGSELHEQLVDDLIAAGAEKRVRWIRTLPDLVLSLSAEHSSDIPGDLKAIQARLREEALSAFISADVLARMPGSHLDPQQCGLPTVTVSARIVTIGEPGDLLLTVRGSAANNETVVEFELEASVLLLIEIPPDVSDLSTVVVSIDSAGASAQLMKRLRFSGLITLDRYERPVGSELTRITARDDDPGLAQWAALSRSYPTLDSGQAADWFKTVGGISFPAGSMTLGSGQAADWYKTVGGISFPAGSMTLGSGKLADWYKTFGAIQLPLLNMTMDSDKLADWYETFGSINFPDLHATMGTVDFADLSKTSNITSDSQTSRPGEVVDSETPSPAGEQAEEQEEPEGDDT